MLLLWAVALAHWPHGWAAAAPTRQVIDRGDAPKTSSGEPEAVRRHALELLNKLPNYTCLETVERHAKGGRCAECEYRDRIRLEVGIVGEREVYSWPGSGRLGDQEIDDLYRGGTVGSGDFGGFLGGIFSREPPSFTYAGEDTVRGKRAQRFTFRVKLADSGYTVSAGRRSAEVGYYGTFWTDPETLDLVRLEAHAADVPPVLGVAKAETTIDYGRVRIGEAEYLLPSRTELVMATTDGLVSRNVTTYSGCRQYVGESTIRFGEEAASAGGASKEEARPEAVLPRGLEMEARLDGPIDFASAAQGDAVTATVTRAAKADGRVAVPKGAVLKGRIAYFRSNYFPTEVTLVALAFEEADFGARRAHLEGELVSAGSYFARTTTVFRGMLAVPGGKNGIREGLRLGLRTR